MQTSLAGLGQQNMQLAKNAAYLEAGRIVVSQLTKAIAPKTPMMLRGYLDTPFGRLLVANALLVASQEVPALRNKPVVQKLAQAGVGAAYVEVLQNFDIEGMVEGFLKDPKIASAVSTVEAA